MMLVMGMSMYDYFNNLILYNDVKDADSVIYGFRLFRKFILCNMAKKCIEDLNILKPASDRRNYTSRTDFDIGLGFFNQSIT